MAWWQTQLIFRRDTLVAETVDEVGLDSITFSTDPTVAPEGEPITMIVVSGYALYGEVRGYYALGVAHMRVDRQSGTGYQSERSEAHQDPVSSLTPTQKQSVREWLRAFSPSAWQTSTEAIKRSLQLPVPEQLTTG